MGRRIRNQTGVDGATAARAGEAPPRGLFMTGTDTEIGKTFSSCVLIHALRRQGLRVAGMKPIASGADDGQPSDAQALLAASGLPLPLRWVNPLAFDPPIAPHIAAAQVGRPIRLAPVLRAWQALAARADLVVVEGVGGWSVPLGPRLMLADLPRRLRLPVLLVVGLRLGCINHALLTARAIRADGCELVGWIGNAIDPAMAVRDDNLQAIAERIGAPLLGVLPHQPATERDPAALATALDAAALLAHLRGSGLRVDWELAAGNSAHARRSQAGPELA